VNAALGLLLAAGLANPASNDTAFSLYLAGQFAQAEAAGIKQNDAQGLAVAARAALAEEQMGDTPCLDCLKHAEDLSRRAIAADPKRPEGHIYLAAAIGYQARIIGDLAAQSKGFATLAKHELDAALADDPNDEWALAALGSWHIEIVRNAGATFGRWLFGARLESGQQYYAKALTIAPDNLVLRYQYALVLAAFDLSANRDEIDQQLTRALQTTPRSAYEIFARDRARQLLETIKRGDAAEIKQLVRRDQGYPE